MSTPGWYPDPAGNPGHFRHWDGSAWSSQTTTDPASAAQLGGAPAPAGRDGWGRGGLLALLAALLVLALLVWGLFLRGGGQAPDVPEDTNSASPTGPVWNEKASPTPSPSGSSDPAPSNAGMVACPTGGALASNPSQDGQLHGGGLVSPTIPGWEDANARFALPWAQDLAAQVSTVYQYPGGSWFSVVSVAALPKGEGFDDPQASARQVMSCFASSSYYAQYSGRKDVVAQPVTVSGRPGFHLRSEVYVQMPELPQVAGDVIDVVVVDTGDAGQLGMFLTSATIGDAERLAQVDRARQELAVG